jgi:hypothetical protein
MPARKSADGAVANLVRSGRKQPQRFRAGSSASTQASAGIRSGISTIVVAFSSEEATMKFAAPMLFSAIMLSQAASAAPQPASPFLGRWAVEGAKLPLPPEQRPKSVTMTFSDAGSGKWTGTVEIVALDGSLSRSHSTYSLDGTPAPIADNAEYDHVAITTPLPNVLIMALSKQGTPGTTRVFTLLPDGKTDIETHVYQTPEGPLSMKTAEWKRLP